MTHAIELPTSLEIVSRGQSATLDISNLSPDVLAQACLHGLKQKVADAAAGALQDAMGDAFAVADAAMKKQWAAEHETDVSASAVNMMEKAIRNLCENGWVATRASNADPLAKYIRAIFRQLLIAPEAKAKKAEYDKCENAKAKNEWIDDLYATHAQKDLIKSKAEKARDEEIAAKKEQAKSVSSLSI